MLNYFLRRRPLILQVVIKCMEIGRLAQPFAIMIKKDLLAFLEMCIVDERVPYPVLPSVCRFSFP